MALKFFSRFHLFPLDMYNFNTIFHGNQLYPVAFGKHGLNGLNLLFINQYSTFILSLCIGSPAASLNALYFFRNLLK